MGINSWLPSWEAEAITLAVMCGELDNLASSRATAQHRSEHMGRMRMVPPECCADVEEEEGREREEEQRGQGKLREITPYGVLTTMDVHQQASSFGSSSTAVSKKTCQNNTFYHQPPGALRYTDLDHNVTLLICNH